MVRRGFTLIEMLAVIAILVVLTAISLPVVEDRLAEARFDSAVRRVDAGMAWARAESQRRGEALRVEARPSEGGTGLFLKPLERAGTKEAGELPGSAREEQGAAVQPFAAVELGLVISHRDPSAKQGDDRPGGSPGELKVGAAGPASEPDAAGVDAAEPLVLATFLPDGSAMAGGPFYISGFGRAASLAVNHWTGGVQIRLLDLSAAKDRAPASESETKAESTGERGAHKP